MTELELLELFVTAQQIVKKLETELHQNNFEIMMDDGERNDFSGVYLNIKPHSENDNMRRIEDYFKESDFFKKGINSDDLVQ